MSIDDVASGRRGRSRLRIGVLAWAEDEMRTHRLAARECVQLSRDLYDRAARLAAV